MWKMTMAILAAFFSQAAQDTRSVDWPQYGSDAGGSRHSLASAINRENVSQLKPAWTFRTGDMSDGKSGRSGSKFQATPVFFHDTVFLSTPFNRVIALHPATGKQIWAYDPKIDLTQRYSEDFVSRGVSTWEDKAAADGVPCKRRIFIGTLDARLIAIDADRGRPCAGFGNEGQIDLTQGVGKVQPGQYEITSPPAVMNDLVVVGSSIGDNRRVEVERGIVRAFHARTGKLHWSWDPIPRNPESPGWSTWTPDGARRTGAANAWSIISADPKLDLVFVPTGSAAPDFYGGERLGDNLYANSVVAIQASTGKVVWHFQVVHHDLWDYDVAAQPLLTTVMRDGEAKSAVVVNTKMGHVFVLDRQTGKPLFPTEERPVPKSDVPGETASATQPFPVLPPPLHPQKLSPDDAWGMDETERNACREQIAALRFDGIFTPPSLQGTLLYPGYVGGVNWGGAAADPARGVMVVNINQLPAWVRLVPRSEFRAKATEARRVQSEVQFTEQEGTPYGMSRMILLSPKGVPCIAPPWARTVAVDLNDGTIKWSVPAPGITLGGAITTAAGLVFVSGFHDQRLRALDIETGKELWAGPLPSAAYATPMTYQVSNGRQYVVIAAGGHPDLDAPIGDYVAAFALP
jgi:quinoprotein glucose dehydrogenase